VDTQTLALTDRRCEECDLYMRIVDRSPGGAVTIYECPLKHQLIVDVYGRRMEAQA
jgi:hypothetical protein